MINEIPTYISLFSSAGIGCYGFKMAGFKCIATNELIGKRLDVQKLNNKCDFETGYVSGDITQIGTKNKIVEEINRWQKLGNDGLDVLIATPPCQGMSVANHKKNEKDNNRNSLVVESIKMIKLLKPKFFVFENVPAFFKTMCVLENGDIKSIEEAITEELGQDYSYVGEVLNFKNYGSNSSRKRTLVIGVHKRFSEYISPLELFPKYQKEKTLREVIGDMKTLEWGQFDEQDFFHQFRTYSEHMRPWVHNLEEGQSAFDNSEMQLKPHKVINGEIVVNKQKNGDKYKRQRWSYVAPCIHTRNDQFASQNTIHPEQDRVFSIRELMKLMTIPDTFKWTVQPLSKLNSLSYHEKRKLLKTVEINIRQSIGEAVPTNIFYQVAKNIYDFVSKKHLKSSQVLQVVEKYDLSDIDKLKKFFFLNPEDYDLASLIRIGELCNSNRENSAAYYTNKTILNKIYSNLPDFKKEEIHILEPSVGLGNFLPFIFKKYEAVQKVNLDLCDIDKNTVALLKIILSQQNIPSNFTIRFITDDFLLHSFSNRYDLIIGNPPFLKMAKTDLCKQYLKQSINKNSSNLFSFFMDKAYTLCDYLVFITPKNILNTNEFEYSREYLKDNIYRIMDFGELGFRGVLIETVCLFVNTVNKTKEVAVSSIPRGIDLVQTKEYAFSEQLPYWVVYRNADFDKVFNKLTFNVFSVYRDREISNSLLSDTESDIRVLKSRNLSDDGCNINDIETYNAYISLNKAKDLTIFKYLNSENVYLTPNMTYKPRVIKKPKGVLVNGSLAILIPRNHELVLTDEDCLYFSTAEYREFYQIARNYQTRSLNVDNSSVYFFGIRK